MSRSLSVFACLLAGIVTGASLVTGPAHAADFDVQPTVVVGSTQSTTLHKPGGLGVGPDGHLWTTDASGFAVGGDTLPGRVSRRVVGGASGLDGADDPALVSRELANGLPIDVAVGPDNYVYVLTSDADDPAVARIRVFHAPNEGALTYTRTIAGDDTGLVRAKSIDVDAQGRVYVAVLGPFDAPDFKVLRFAVGASSNATPEAVITDTRGGTAGVSAVTVLPGGGLAVGTTAAKVSVFPAAAVDSASGPSALTSTRQFSAPAIVTDLDADAQGNLYASMQSNSNDAGVAVFDTAAPDLAGPTHRITGTTTGLHSTTGVAVGPLGEVYVAQGRVAGSASEVRRFASLSTLLGNGGGTGGTTPTPGGGGTTPTPGTNTPASVTAPSSVISLKVTGKKAAKKRAVSWKAPTAGGGAPLARYEVQVTAKVKKSGKKKAKVTVVYATTVPATGTATTFKATVRKLKAGKNTIQVRAVNIAGKASAWASTTITVKKKTTSK